MNTTMRWCLYFGLLTLAFKFAEGHVLLMTLFVVFFVERLKPSDSGPAAQKPENQLNTNLKP